MKHPLLSLSLSLSLFCFAKAAQVPVVWDTSTGDLVSAINLDADVLDLTDDYSPTGTWDFTGGTITVTDGDLPATLTRDSELGTLATQDAATIGDSLIPDVTTSRNLGSLSKKWGAIYTDNVFGGVTTASVYMTAPYYDFVGSTDTTLTRSSAGVLAVEGVDVLTTATGYTQAAADAAFATAAQGALADSAQQPPAEGAFTDGDKTKLDGIETAADVTDTANVTAAGALMDSEVDADLKTLDLPASTTISSFGATLTDDADASTARATLGVTALLADKADVAAMTAALAVRSYPLSDGIYADGTDEAFTVPQQAATDIGTTDFSRGLPALVLVDYTPASAITLWTNESGNTGIRLILETDGTLSLEFGDGADWDASYSTTEDLSGIAAYTPVTLSLAADRDGNCQFYLDGIALEAVDISGASAIDVDTASAWTILDAAEGWVYGQYWASTKLITSDQAFAYYTLPDSTQRLGVGGIVYESDWSAGVNGWSDVNGLATAPETVAAVSDAIKFTSDTADTQQMILEGISSSGDLRVVFDYYIPSSNTSINQVDFLENGGADSAPFGTTDSWETAVYDFTQAGTTEYRIRANANGDTTPGSSVGDVFYVKNFTLLNAGMVELIDLSVAGATKTDLIGSNDATRGSNAVDAL